MYKDICDAVYTLINTNKNSLKINYVYNFDKAVMDEWFASCTITPSANNATILDNNSYEVNVPVTIRIFWDAKNLATTEENIRKTADDTLKLLMQNYVLNWKSINLDLSFNFWYTWDPAYRIFEITATYKTDFIFS